MLSFKQVEFNHGKTDFCKWCCSWIIKFLIVWILDVVNMLLLFFQFELIMAVATRCMQGGEHLNNIWTFLRRVNFIFMFFKELPSLLRAESHFLVI